MDSQDILGDADDLVEGEIDPHGFGDASTELRQQVLDVVADFPPWPSCESRP